MSRARSRRTGRRCAGHGGAPGTVLAAVLTVGALVLVAGTSFPPGAAGAVQTPSARSARPVYLALGGSGSVGIQPSSDRPHGRPTDRGYANDLTAAEQGTWPGLRLVELGCPGETTATMLDGGARCSYPGGSQLSAAVSFLHRHPSTRLVTVDLGFNDLVPCLRHHRSDPACVTAAIARSERQLPRILATLRAAGGPGLRIIGVGHYDPYLGTYLDGPSGRAFAEQTVHIVTRFDGALRALYGAAGDPMADVAGAFQLDDTMPTPTREWGVVPGNVARTCRLTWMCGPAPEGPNPHPDDAGYRAIASALAAALPTASGPVD